MDNKKYYWIKLKTEFFNQATIDFLLSQTNGCEYVVLYQMLCLNTANNNGILSTNIGEIIVPYDVNKIARDTKYFSEDTIRVAMELYKQLGLIYEGDDDLLKITGFDDMVGSETKWAEKKRIYREKQKLLGHSEDIVRQENRDKRLENRYKSIDNKEKENIKEKELFTYIEKEFGRTLSNIEIEMIDGWLLLYDIDVIKYAIDISILSNKKTFKYVNGIIKNWNSCNYKSLEEIKQNEKPKETKPSWMDKKIEKQEMTQEEMDEFEKLLEDFR